MFLTLFCLLASRLVQPLCSSPCMCGKAMVEEATLPNNLTMDKILRHLTVMREADRLESDTSSGIVSIGDEDLTTDIIAAAALGEATFQDDVIPAHVKDDVDLNHIQDDVDLAPVADGDSKLPESSPLVVAPIHLRTVIDPEIGETALEPIVSESATDMPSERIPVEAEHPKEWSASPEERASGRSSERIQSVGDRLAGVMDEIRSATTLDMGLKANSERGGGDDAVLGSIINLPDVACEEGKKRDAAGKCRKVV
nr:PREDICTED: uncharacterized protein LOC109030868 isoform X1 [Bemisia tabaci]